MENRLGKILRDIPLPVLDSLIISLGLPHSEFGTKKHNEIGLSIKQAEEMIRLNISHAIMSGVEGDLKQ